MFAVRRQAARATQSLVASTCRRRGLAAASKPLVRRAPALPTCGGRVACRACSTSSTAEGGGASSTQAVDGSSYAVQRRGDGCLLLKAATSTSLKRGRLVTEGGVAHVCLLEVDKYWYALALDADSTAAQCLQRPTPTQAERARLAEYVSSGVAAVDTLAPIGLGQSMLICGPVGSGKTVLAREIIENSLEAGRFARIVRVSTDALGTSAMEGETGTLVEEHEASTLQDLLAALNSAEVLREQGNDTLVVLDTAQPFIKAWDDAVEMAKAAREGAPLDKDLLQAQRRNYFSGLTERAAYMLDGGSLTLLVIVDTDAMAAMFTSGVASAAAQSGGDTVYTLADFDGRSEKELKRLRDLADRNISLTMQTLTKLGIQAPGGEVDDDRVDASACARELQSLSDGQIVLDLQAAQARQFPAVEPGASFSRFGLGRSKADTAAAEGPGAAAERRDVRPPALQAVAAHLRMQVALEREVHFRPPSGDAAKSPQAGADGALSTRMAIVRAALLQTARARMTHEEITAVLLACCSGALDALPEAEAAKLVRGGKESALLSHLREAVPGVLATLKAGGKLEGSLAKELDVSVRLFVALRKAAAVLSGTGAMASSSTSSAASAAL
eukprot:TRINITY_DN40859_c0_g1_i2.p1 TRINITY_DN40859_c0_g1~~TRINITY_DN40859_c0_g1_i2.p1  ORF type:complete len:615 (+),score=138.74 TRINITY_DN40859_c0_g1_i2:80-1924(+)